MIPAGVKFLLCSTRKDMKEIGMTWERNSSSLMLATSGGEWVRASCLIPDK